MASTGGNESGSSDGNSSRDGRRQPRTLEGVLQMAIENTPTEELGGNQETRNLPLDEERKDFLNQVFAEMYKDETKEIVQCLQIVAQKVDSENEDDEEQVEQSLEYLSDLCDSFDNAQDFHKVGGTPLLFRLMEHPRSEVRWRTFELMATIVQNVPLNQNVMLEMGAVPKLLASVDKDSSDLTRVKALYALSCLARDNGECQKVFVENDGFSVLMRAMQSNVEKLQIKSAFMLQALFQTPIGSKDTLHKMGMVHQLIGLLQTSHTPTHEHFMAALLNLVSGHADCIQDCRQPEMKFKTFLADRLKMLKDKPEFEEEYSYCQQLMKICFSDNLGNSTAVDR